MPAKPLKEIMWDRLRRNLKLAKKKSLNPDQLKKNSERSLVHLATNYALRDWQSVTHTKLTPLQKNAIRSWVNFRIEETHKKFPDQTMDKIEELTLGVLGDETKQKKFLKVYQFYSDQLLENLPFPWKRKK